MKRIFIQFIPCFLIFCSFTMVKSQPATYIVDKVNISVKGSSSLHDWTAKCGEVFDYSQQLSLDPSVDGIIENFGFSVAVSSMDGGRGSSMNEKIFKALESEVHPNVSYIQNRPAKVTSSGDGSFMIASTGSLEIAGQIKEITVEVSGVIEGNALVLSGVHAMKLSDFKIDPPSAMFGQIQTKDDIFVHFEFRYRKEQ